MLGLSERCSTRGKQLFGLPADGSCFPSRPLAFCRSSGGQSGFVQCMAPVSDHRLFGTFMHFQLFVLVSLAYRAASLELAESRHAEPGASQSERCLNQQGSVGLMLSCNVGS